MNAVNRVTNRSIFIPDPWTATHVTGPASCRRFYSIVRRLVNENTHGLALRASDLFFFPACVLPNITRKLLVPTVKTLALAITGAGRQILLDLPLASVFITQ